MKTVSEVISLILGQIEKHQIKPGEKVTIPVTWGKSMTSGVKHVLRSTWQTTPTVEGSKSLQTLTVTVKPTMCPATS